MPSRTDHADWMKLSAAVSGLSLEFIAGVSGDEVLDKALPFPPHRNLGNGNIGSWRAHMNTLAHIVSNDISTALIMEDDVDWDVRIKKQMNDFARGTRALSQPIRGTNHQYVDPTFLDPKPDKPQQRHELLNDDRHFDIFKNNTPETEIPTISPYGDNWDVLWVGHCSVHFPRARDQMPKGRYLIVGDETMIHTEAMMASDPWVLPQNYPAFTRIVHHAWDPICTYAYAVSQKGARKILWELGIKRFDRAFDNMMAEFCDMNTCLTVSPQLFSAFQAAGPKNRDSEINGFGQDKNMDIRLKGKSENIQKSVRLNMHALLQGADITKLEDQYPHP